MHILIELGRESIVAGAIVDQIDPFTVKSGLATPIKMICVVIGAHVRVAAIELVERIVLVIALCESSRSANQCSQEQEKDSGHSRRLLVDPGDFGLKLYRYINNANPEKIPRLFGKLSLFLA